MSDDRRVLILEDEALVALALGDYLEALDWTPLATVATVDEALAALDEQRVELAILDCNLGGEARSWAVADRLAAEGVPFLFSSGLSSGQLPERLSGRPMLVKPYSLASLEAAIRDLSL